MTYIERLEYWGDRHHPAWMDIVRIALGLFLIVKGIQFLTNMSALLNLVSSAVSFNSFILILLSHYIVFAHLVGGLALMLGILTRVACLLQIPILLGAIVTIGAAPELFRPFSELLLSIVVLGLLVFFLIAGDGPLSFSSAVDRNNEEQR